MVGGTALAAVGAYGFQILSGRALGPVEFAPLSVLWTLQVLVFLVALLPLEQLVIRRLELTGGRSAGLRADARPLGALLVACLASTLAVAWITRERFLAGSTAYVLVAGLLVIGYGVFAVARGHLAGRHRYRAYGVATAAEAVLRLVLTGVVLLLGPSGPLLAGVMVVAPFAVLLVSPFRHGRSRRLALQPPEEAFGAVGGFLGPLVLANALSQVLLVAPPLALAALNASPAEVSVVFLTFALFRGPLWVVQSAMARVLPPFTALAARGEHRVLREWARRLALIGVAVSLVGWTAGRALGQGVVGLLFGGRFAPAPALAALVAAGMGLAAVVLVSTQILVALGQTHRLALGWASALAAAVAATALMPAAPSLRVGAGFLAGELTAFVAITALVLSVTTPRTQAEREEIRWAA